MWPMSENRDVDQTCRQTDRDRKTDRTDCMRKRSNYVYVYIQPYIVCIVYFYSYYNTLPDTFRLLSPCPAPLYGMTVKIYM